MTHSGNYMFKGIAFVLITTLSTFTSANQFVEINGNKLEYEIAGEGPLHVLFDAGALTGMAGWDAIWNDLPNNITAVRFSRLGEGRSEPCQGQRTDSQHVNEVDAIVSKLGIKQPFLYVGHSLGGATARNYASAHRGNLSGMLLVDPENPKDVDIIKEIDPVNGPKEIEKIRLNDYEMGKGEWCFLDAIWKKEKAKDFDDIGDIPVTLIATVMKQEASELIFFSDLGRKRWGEIQRDWVKTFPRGKFVATNNSGHYIQQDEPELVLSELSQLIYQITKNK